MQSRRWSLIETVASTAIGFIFSLLVQIFLVWAYDVKMTHSQNLQFVFWFTIASVIRGYYVRRFFNWVHQKLALVKCNNL